MYTLSAFADEISPDPVEQIDVLSKCDVHHVELRSIHKTNVLALTDLQVKEFESLLKKHGFGISAIGSPIGKVKIDSPFDEHLAHFRRALELCKVFGTSRIRLFSYYPPGDAADWNGVEPRWHKEVFDRMAAKARLAEAADVRLVHENEHRIFGDSPDRVAQLFEQVKTPALRAVYDAANYVFCGYDPWEGWKKTKELTVHFHAKDWKRGAAHGSPMGEGDGRWPEVIADAHDFVGFATLEPHLLGGGPTGGVTGAELFPKAVEAFRRILDRAGVQHD